MRARGEAFSCADVPATVPARRARGTAGPPRCRAARPGSATRSGPPPRCRAPLEQVEELARNLCLWDSDLFENEYVAEQYRVLSKADKLRAVELMTKPTGFTVLAARGDSHKRLGPRVAGNMIPKQDLSEPYPRILRARGPHPARGDDGRAPARWTPGSAASPSTAAPPPPGAGAWSASAPKADVMLLTAPTAACRAHGTEASLVRAGIDAAGRCGHLSGVSSVLNWFGGEPAA
jgi:hypothetical protein